MKVFSALIFILVFGACDPVFASDFPEPPFKYLVNFERGEIPGMGALYFDFNDDQRGDLITAHTILKIVRVSKCFKPEKRDKVILIWEECKTGSPKVYVLDRKIEHVKTVDEKWATIIERTWKHTGE